MSAPLCPSCSSRLHYSLASDWYRCELCDNAVTGELVARKRRTRLGRLWLRVLGLMFAAGYFFVL